ncbi:MAG TPA: DUF4162 domain-containing protein, partial [Candidatus Micrarchaeota archaeon]|nr:DUF4162 domain-containing protein [Candidatus Micrarchaeota archaeon]
QSLNKSGITIIYTTHDMDEADKLCDRIAVMDKGKIIALGTGAELKRMHGGNSKILLTLSQHGEQVARELAAIAGTKDYACTDGHIELDLPSASAAGAVRSIISHLSKKGIDIKDISMREPTLEEVFINLTKKDVRD